MEFTITLKDAVRGEVALTVLSGRKLKGKMAREVARASRQTKTETEAYRKGVRGILEDYGAIPDDEGSLRLDPKAKNYKKAREELEQYEEDSFKTEVKLTNVAQLTFDEFLAGIPAEKDGEGNDIPDSVTIEPFILEGLYWLLKDEQVKAKKAEA